MIKHNNEMEDKHAIDGLLQIRAAAVCRHLRLNLRHRTWRGATGQWAGKGSGSSIDFKDHRPYLPGDDPRHIDWAAYARSGNYMMKLYRGGSQPQKLGNRQSGPHQIKKRP